MQANSIPKRVLVTRFSSLGDIALTIPVIELFLKENPYYEVIFVSRPYVSSLFQDIERVIFKPIDLEKKHKGVLGIIKFYKTVKDENIVAYADLHNVIRTKILQGLTKINNIPTASLDKGRKEKKQLIKSGNRSKKQLKTTLERYADVFRELGFQLNKQNTTPFSIRKEMKVIGIAPFAMFKSKSYPIENLQQVGNYFIEKGYKIILFGGGKNEKEILTHWAKQHVNLSVVNASSLAEEINLIRKLSFMIAMDSANMHLASLAQTAVFSIWGGTHQFAGFLGNGQNESFAIEDNQLECRPCSIFGRDTCYRKDFACMQNIKPEIIIKKIEEQLKQ